MPRYLHEIHELREAAGKDFLVIYHLRGKKFFVERNDYPDFCKYWCRLTAYEPLVMDLASAAQHRLVFDVDFKPKITGRPNDFMISIIESAFKKILLPYCKHFTYIVTARQDSPGMHVHLPEFVIGHDDYILLCQQLFQDLNYTIPDLGIYELDTLKNCTLPGAAKPHTPPYKPYRIVYVDEKHTHTMPVDDKYNFASQLRTYRQVFKRVKANDGSFFRKLLFLEEMSARQNLTEYLMPVPAQHAALHKLAFPTLIGSVPNASLDHVDVATFTKKRSDDLGYVCKGRQLMLDGSHYLKTFYFLKHNTFVIETLETNNYALKTWYERTQLLHPNHIHANPIFDWVNGMLQERNERFTEDPNPIKTLLEFNDGYYFLPVFYALCKVLDISSRMMVHHLTTVVDKAFTPLLDRLEQVDETHTRLIMQDLTKHTLLFCGNNLCGRFTRNRDRMQHIVKESVRGILSVVTLNNLYDLIRDLQESYFPIQMMKMAQCLRKSNAFVWNSLTESWQEILMDKEKESHLLNLWQAIQCWVKDYHKSGQFGGPDDDVMKKFVVHDLMSKINSDCSMERKKIQMDQHKWFIRTRDGCLDLLTGHIGGTVPELYLSDRKLGIDTPRPELMRLYNRAPDLERLYALLTTQSFFQRYLKALFTDQTDDLYDTLYELVQESHMDLLQQHPYAATMLHFYTHLCKYTAFEYDLLLYLLDVLASIFIATNYERKFYVCKGETSNGKSKLFELLNRVFGGYYHCIQSDNLKPNSSGTTATPDLASTLFNCRIVTTEELEGKLNENRVKQITGNSSVVFRNMYESSQSGIPTAKIFTTTNNVPDCQASEAFKDRCVAIPFASRFVNKPPTTTSEQVRLHQYGKDEYVIERSYMGCFLILSYHLKKCINLKDGLLYTRDPPPSVVEYTRQYLLNTDVYNQFKTHMDVQPSSDCMTTMTDLRSAVRQFLKNTKNNTTPETDIILKFEEEFSEWRRSDLQLGSMQYEGVLDHASSSPLVVENELLEPVETPGGKRVLPPIDGRKRKKHAPDTIVYYENVIIRNLRKATQDN